MIPLCDLDQPDGVAFVQRRLASLRLSPAALLSDARLLEQQEQVRGIMLDVAKRGDAALVDVCRRFDDPGFTEAQIRVSVDEMRQASARVPEVQMAALRRSIAQVREYQQHVMPVDPPPLRRGGLELGLRYTPLDAVGLYFPGGKASYPSSLIMLAAPAQVAGVKRVVVCTPPSRFGRSDLILAAALELGLTDVYRAGGAAAIAAMAIGTTTIPGVDKIAGPGNTWVQLAKRLVAGSVGIDGFLGPSEVLVMADSSAHVPSVAADMLAQAEHDPGSCFLLTDSADIAQRVIDELGRQIGALARRDAIERALRDYSMVVVARDMNRLIELANELACEHVSLQTRDDAAVLRRIRHAGAVYVGRHSPVAAGDYVAGPSHCLPTNTTARFASGVSVLEFLKRSSVVRYDAESLSADAPAIQTLALAEQLDAHAASVAARSAR